MSNRLLIYFLYDKNGVVDDYVTYFLKTFQPYCKEVCVVVNGVLTKDSELKLKEYTNKILIRENFGYDSYAYKFAIESYGFDNIKKYDELILANYTMYGPIYSPSEMFEKMRNKNCDFWGITKCLKSKNKIANLEVNEHLQSYFITIKKNILEDSNFKTYWDTLNQPTTYSEAVAFHELRFTKYFNDLGYKFDSYIDLKKYEKKMKNRIPFYPICQQVEEDRMPFIKRKAFIEYKGLFENQIEKGPLYLIDYIKNNTSYNINLILSDIKRTSFYNDTFFTVFKKLLYCLICFICLFWKCNHYCAKIKALMTFVKFKKKYGKF